MPVANGRGGWVFPSSVYPSLVTNFPKQVMQWQDWAWGDEVDMFPGHAEVLEYVCGYFRRLGVKEGRAGGGGRGDTTVEEVEEGVTAWFGKVVTKVEKVEKVGKVEGEGAGWRVVVGVVGSGGGGGDEEEERYYDAVVIATGRYTVPYIPSLPGLEEWVLAGKGSRLVEHSREFREVEERYKGKVSPPHP